MDSKVSFGLVMVCFGLLGMWLLVTGKLSTLVNFAFTAPASAAATTGTSTITQIPIAKPNLSLPAGVSLPTINTTTAAVPLGSTTAAYGVVVGDSGAKIEPVGAASYV